MKEPTRVTVYAAIAVSAVAVAGLHRAGVPAWLRETFEGWGLSRFTVNVLFGGLLGVLFGTILRGLTAMFRRDTGPDS